MKKLLRLNSKGFTLAELLIVMIILAIMAAVSAPFVKGYIRDAQNGRAKSAMVQVAEAYKNFKYDYPKAGISASSQVTATTKGTGCGKNTISYNDSNNSADVLVYCNYLKPLDWNGMKYNFYVGSGCSACTAADAYIEGTEASGGEYGSGYCACVESNGKIKDTLQN